MRSDVSFHVLFNKTSAKKLRQRGRNLDRRLVNFLEFVDVVKNPKQRRVIASVRWNKIWVATCHLVGGNVYVSAFQNLNPWIAFQLGFHLSNIRPTHPCDAVVAGPGLSLLPSQFQATNWNGG